MSRICNCKDGKFNFQKGGIFFFLNTDPYTSEYECIECQTSMVVYKRDMRDYKNIYLINIVDTMFSKEIYKKEVKSIEKVIASKYGYDILSNYKLLANILGYIIKIYNKEYYEKYFKYKFEKVRTCVIELAINEYLTSKREYIDYDILLKKLDERISSEKSDFDIEYYISNYSTLDEDKKDVFVYGPCACGLSTIRNGNLVDSLNKIFLEKIEYKKNERKIISDILEIQSNINYKFRGYIKRLVFCGELSQDFFDKLDSYDEYETLSFIERFLCYTDKDEKVLDKWKIIITGIKDVLKEVLETKYILSEDITFDNHTKLLSILHHNNEILEKYI